MYTRAIPESTPGNTGVYEEILMYPRAIPERVPGNTRVIPSQIRIIQGELALYQADQHYKRRTEIIQECT